MSGPTVGNLSPDPSVAIAAVTPLAFDVVDAAAGFRSIVVIVKFAAVGGVVPPWETAYDGASFGPNYSTLSTIGSITNGFHFRVRRDGGWPSTPTLAIVAVDTAGAMA